MKKIIALVLCLVLALSMVACSSKGKDAETTTAAAETTTAAAETTTAAAAETTTAAAAAATTAPGADAKTVKADKTYTRPASGWKFGYTCMDGTNPFFVALEASIRKVVEGNGDTLISYDPANDSTKQIQQIEDMISQNVDVMFVNPVDADGIIPALDELKNAGILMFGFDTQVGDMSYLVSYAGSNNYNAGFVCGQDLAKKVPNGGDIIVLDSPTMQSITDRTNGFMDAIKASGVTFNVVSQLDSKGNQEVAANNAEDALNANHNVVAIFGGNDPTALGAYSAAEAAGVKCLIYGVDGSPDVKKLLGKGLMEGTGAQSPVTIGKTIAETAYDYLNGKEIKSFIPIDTFLVTADNVAKYGTDGWQ